MASASQVQLSAKDSPGYLHVDNISEEAAQKASDLLNENREQYHAYLHGAGLHNHILHHLLAIYPLGASAAQLQAAYSLNAPGQRPKGDPSDAALAELSELSIFRKRLGNESYYAEYLKFFTDEISKHGVEATLNRFCFCGDELAEDLFPRLFGGLLHPIIHLGYGLEYNQPSIVAEALASAAIHVTFVEPICFPAEKLAEQRRPDSNPSIMSLVSLLRNDPVVITAISEEDTHNKLLTDLMPRAGAHVHDVISRYTVEPDRLQESLAEMLNTAIYLTIASQRPGKEIMFDFYLMHTANLAFFYPLFMSLSWLSTENKCRLLKWKVWLDLAVYASCKCPDLRLERVLQYQPEHEGGWDSIFVRAAAYQDDGHTAKLIRAIKMAEIVSRPYDGRPQFPMPTEAFLLAAHMVMDSVEQMCKPGYRRVAVDNYIPGIHEEVLRTVARWIRFCGTEIAWKNVPSLPSSTTPRGS
ncbi:uncharacterized protein Z518_04609 [Rhinocladiella mackenziei CBS 650.93]|uniref:HypA-like protein n=1 Tax=Rhinocladiella mackenziei CBS 650.93 TaxID=1442369 RepID=A0A0D2H883_9EURO|nr:uncharacterized protein Z518_04609 [Rhinocladiella mackenziei CBS 650.93]KIX06633.1 hypothetical protein Z518_04609 [Rhinocladiella mackenziei CBS 650.93]